MNIKINPPEGVPSEMLEEAADKMFKELAREWVYTIEGLASHFRDEMRDAWEAAGGDPNDCMGFEELNDVADIVRRECEPQGKVPPFNGIRKEIG